MSERGRHGKHRGMSVRRRRPDLLDVVNQALRKTLRAA
jgi:hypothetical protein